MLQSSTLNKKFNTINLMNTLGDRIKFERLRKKLTQEALGKLVGVGKSSVSQWESGMTKKNEWRKYRGTGKSARS